VLHIWEFVATSMFAIGFLINGRNPQKNVWCFDEGTYGTQSNVTACGVQGRTGERKREDKRGEGGEGRERGTREESRLKRGNEGEF
jgi:hypothetical protein